MRSPTALALQSTYSLSVFSFLSAVWTFFSSCWLPSVSSALSPDGTTLMLLHLRLLHSVPFSSRVLPFAAKTKPRTSFSLNCKWVILIDTASASENNLWEINYFFLFTWSSTTYAGGFGQPVTFVKIAYMFFIFLDYWGPRIPPRSVPYLQAGVKHTAMDFTHSLSSSSSRSRGKHLVDFSCYAIQCHINFPVVEVSELSENVRYTNYPCTACDWHSTIFF